MKDLDFVPNSLADLHQEIKEIKGEQTENYLNHSLENESLLNEAKILIEINQKEKANEILNKILNNLNLFFKFNTNQSNSWPYGYICWSWGEIRWAGDLKNLNIANLNYENPENLFLIDGSSNKFAVVSFRTVEEANVAYLLYNQLIMELDLKEKGYMESEYKILKNKLKDIEVFRSAVDIPILT